MEQAASDWFLDEGFWTTFYSYMFSETSYTAAREQAGHLLALTGLTTGTVLDLACGPGRHSVPLAQRGFRVIGVDSTPFLLEKARAYAATANVDVEWVQDDMRQFIRSNAFDLAVNLFTSFGYFEAPQENQRVIENIAASLKPRGHCVLDVIGKEVLARIFQPTSAHEIPGAGLLVQRRQVIDDWRRITNEWTLIQAGVVHTFRMQHWLYSGAELRGLLLSSGFTTVRLYGNFEGAAYDPDATRLIAVARKSGE
jgi:2-polyprenyl-3-methyl-5-hydroxy-6-metoxy-1,4-benzoquinol methylase